MCCVALGMHFCAIPMMSRTKFDPAAPLQFVINAAADGGDANAKCAVVEIALRDTGRSGNC